MNSLPGTWILIQTGGVCPSDYVCVRGYWVLDSLQDVKVYIWEVPKATNFCKTGDQPVKWTMRERGNSIATLAVSTTLKPPWAPWREDGVRHLPDPLSLLAGLACAREWGAIPEQQLWSPRMAGSFPAVIHRQLNSARHKRIYVIFGTWIDIIWEQRDEWQWE